MRMVGRLRNTIGTVNSEKVNNEKVWKIFLAKKHNFKKGDENMNAKKYDIAVIGSGAGLMVVEAALNSSMRVALIEASKFGGTCLTKGCIPSKMLVYPADVIRETAEAGRVGLNFDKPAVDWKLISERMWKQINYSETMEKSLDRVEGLGLYKGFAEFVSPDTLRVRNKDERYDFLSADKIVIAAGAHSFIPEIEGLEEAGYITSESFFGEKYPHEKPWDSLIIVGDGAIAAEFAHIFSAFGTKITLISKHERILRSEEEEISDTVSAQFSKNGIKVLRNKNTLSASSDGKQKTITVEDKLTGEKTQITAQEIFIATGVKPYSDTLSLDKAGVATDSAGWIVTDEYMQTTRKGIYAIGDINGKFKFRHKANYEAEILIDNLFGGGEKRKASYDSVPWAIFTNPQIAHVGITERQAKERGLSYKVSRNSYSSIAGGIAMGYGSKDGDAGFAKLISDGKGKLLGAHIVGPQAAILVQPFVYLMACGIGCEKSHKGLFSFFGKDCVSPGTLSPIRNSMVIHPSLSELTAWAIDGL